MDIARFAMSGFLRKTRHVGLEFHILGWMGRLEPRPKFIVIDVNVSCADYWGVKKNE